VSTLIDRELVNWETDLVGSVSKRRREIEEKYGAEKYQQVLARAMQRDEMAATAYQTWGRLADEATQNDNPTDQTAYLRALNEAKKQALASVPDRRVQPKVQERIESELRDVIDAAAAFKGMKDQFGLVYGSPDDALQEFVHRPEAMQGALSHVMGSFSDFRKFWDEIRPDVERIRRMSPDSEDAVEKAVAESATSQAMGMLLSDGTSRMTVRAATGGDPRDFVYRRFLKGLDEKDRAVVEANPEPFSQFAQARALYIQGAASAEAMASQASKEKGTTYREELAAQGRGLQALHAQLVEMKKGLPGISREAALWVPPDADRIAEDPKLPAFFQGMARKALETINPFAPEGSAALAFPRGEEPKHRLNFVPWNAQAWGEAVSELGISLAGFAGAQVALVGRVGAIAAKMGAGKILTRAAQEAAVGGAGMLAQPETVKEVSEGRLGSTAARAGAGAVLGGAVGGAVGGVQGALAGRRAAGEAVATTTRRAAKTSGLARQVTPETVGGSRPLGAAKPPIQLGRAAPAPVTAEAMPTPAVPAQPKPLPKAPAKAETPTTPPFVAADAPKGADLRPRTQEFVSTDFPVKPIRHQGAPPTADEIKVALGESAGTAIRTLPQPKGALGSFQKTTGTTSIGDAPDIPSAFHEYAHRVDTALNIRKRASAAALAELDKPMFSRSIPNGANAETIGRERFAEFIRAMGTNPSLARREAPLMAKHFVSAIGQKSFAQFAKSNLMLRKVAGSDPMFRAAANIRNLGEGVGTKPHELPFPWWRKPFQSIFDPTQPQSAARKLYETMTGKPMRPTQDPRYWMSRYFAGQDAVREMAKRGLVDRKGGFLKDDATGSLMNEEWRVKPIADLMKTGLSESEANKLVGALMTSESSAERTLRGAGRTGVGLGIQKDIEVAAKNIFASRGISQTSLTNDQITLIREAARRTRKVYDVALDRAVNAHLMTEADAAALRAANQHYAHLGRFLEETPFESTRIKTNALKAATGSGRTIINPAQMAWSVLAETERRAGMNMWKLGLARMARGPSSGYTGSLKDFHLIGREVPEATTTSTMFLEKGVEKHIVFDTKIKKMLDLYQNPSSAMMGASWASWPARILQTSVVHVPKFATGQLIKEIQDAFVKSASTRFIPTQPLGTLRQTAKTMHEYVISGGGHHGYYANGPMDWVKYQQATTQRLMDEGHVVLDPRKLIPRAWEKYVETLRELTDTRMKAAEFQRLKAEGLAKGHSVAEAKAEATIHAREMQDYSLVGESLMGIAKFVPFLRGGLSGTYAEIRALRRNWKLFVARGSVLSGGLLVAEEGIHAAAGTLDELRAMPNWARDMYIWIPTGPGEKWVALPTGWLLGGFRSLVRRTWEASQGSKTAWRDMGESMWTRFSPIDTPTQLTGPLSVPIQLKHNFSDFTDRSIVPEWEKDRPVSERKGAKSASRLGQFVHDLVDPLNKYAVDPRQADFFVEQTFGLAGAALLGLSDVGRPESRKSVPLLGVFRERPRTTEKISQAFEVIRKSGKSSDLSYKAMRRRIDLADKEKDKRAEHIRVADQLAARLIAKYGGK
jgi:hypothetical protein